MTTDSLMTIRLPADVKTWLEAQSRYTRASQNAEIIRAVRERMERVVPPNEALPETKNRRAS